MTESPATVTPLARPKQGVIRARLREAKLSAVDSAVGKPDSWAKKIHSGDCGVLLDDMELFLAALDLKAVDTAKVCATPWKYSHEYEDAE